MSESRGSNPVLIEVTRGELVESRHRGSIAIADAEGELIVALGDVEGPIFPRSAVKAMQALPLVESGAADAFVLNDAELAVACGSHSGDTVHLDAVRSILSKAGLKETHLACGSHWPMSERASRELAGSGGQPGSIHNNCSGKHASMLATAVHLGLDTRGYEQPSHPVQRSIARAIAELCGVEIEHFDVGVDGCSVPTFAVPLAALATGFARLASGKKLPRSRASAAALLVKACFAEPAVVAGEGRFDTIVMRGLAPFVFVKGGAEGVHCAGLPRVGIGIAVKMDDGVKRGTEAVLAHLLASLVPQAQQVLSNHVSGDIRNWRGRKVGQIRAAPRLRAACAELAAPALAIGAPRR
jgi:L-asparaginase II